MHDFVRKWGCLAGIAPLGNFSIIQCMARHTDACIALATLSGKDLEFVNKELSEFPGMIEGLKNFYLFHDCFPSEVECDS